MVGNGHDLFGAPLRDDRPDADAEPVAAVDGGDPLRPPPPVSFWEAWRHRRRYVRPAGKFIGFGRVGVEQPELFEATFRVGWWFWDICPVNPAAGLIERIAWLQEVLDKQVEILRGRVNR